MSLATRTAVTFVAAILSTGTQLFAQTATSSVSYSTPDRGGMVLQTAGGTNNPPVVGYALAQPSASTTPSGAAIFDLRQNGVLVTEAAVPGMTAITSGRTYAEVNGLINTGIAFANPSSAPVTISFNFTDQNGRDFGQGSFALAANGQTAKFLSEAPFRAPSFTGTFTFNASAPVGVVSIRATVNQRGEFLITTQTVTPLPNTLSAGAFLVPHFADAGGWTTELILVNATDGPVSGTVQFFDEGTSTTAGRAITLNVNGLVASSFSYSIPQRSSVKLDTLGLVTAATQVGSIVITPNSGSAAPSASTVFSFSQNGVITSTATVQVQPAGVAFRTYVEANSRPGVPGAIQSGIAISNNSTTSATVNFELRDLTGFNTGLTASVIVPASGHVSKFLQDLIPSVSLPFQGILRITSANSIGIVSLRMRYNERGDFLVTTIPVTNETSPSTTAQLVFPQIVDQGGYSTEFIVFSGIAGQSTNGTLQFFGQGGQPLNLTVH